MNILAIGDVVGSVGCRFLRSHLPALKKTYHIDVVIANGENSADGNGITPVSAQYLYQSGVDIITGGNHSFRRREVYPVMDEDDTLLRPHNYPPDAAPGKGVCIYDMGRIQLAVINLIGTMYMESMPCPFRCVEALLREGNLPRIVLVDFHAEATSEKRALGFYLDGKASAVFGTHTHVPTADARVLPGGTAVQTDVGMAGAAVSVLGRDVAAVLQKFTIGMPNRLPVVETGAIRVDAAVVTYDYLTGRASAIESISREIVI